jgi:hypothetical protein
MWERQLQIKIWFTKNLKADKIQLMLATIHIRASDIKGTIEVDGVWEQVDDSIWTEEG